MADSGEPFLSDMEGLGSKLYTHVFDIDIASGYPTTGVVMNISKETTLREVCEIEGMTEAEQRRIGVNMTAIKTNAIDLGQSLYGLPGMNELLKHYKQSHGC